VSAKQCQTWLEQGQWIAALHSMSHCLSVTDWLPTAMVASGLTSCQGVIAHSGLRLGVLLEAVAGLGWPSSVKQVSTKQCWTNCPEVCHHQVLRVNG
jgi:hypothetical protein